MSGSSSRPRVLFVVGSGYSGTTLLDMIVGSHPLARGFGELRTLDRFMSGDAPCTCGARATACAFWRRVMGSLGPEPFQLYPPPAPSIPILISQTLRLLHALAAVTGARLLVDSSKWVERARHLHESGELDARVVHLVRDGRGVVWSHARRGAPIGEAAENWRRRNLGTLEWLAAPDAPPHLLVRYEDLAGAPEPTIRRVCELVELDYRPEMLDFRAADHHLVSGNPMRFETTTRIAVDEAWRDALTAEDLALFTAVAGELAGRLGYPV
ncbi:MAG TPA: sulfotransferase [Kofleriaceae bacterium]|nr:sulfotransferase [Kofleriaceae bacterium]